MTREVGTEEGWGKVYFLHDEGTGTSAVGAALVRFLTEERA